MNNVEQEPSGIEDILDSLGAFDPPAAEAAPSEPPAATDPPAPPAPRDPLADPVVQRVVEERAAALREQERLAELARQREDYIRSLPDADYGRIRRQQEAFEQNTQALRDQIALSFYQEGYVGLVNAFPELKSLSPDEAAALDPTSHQSYTSLAAAMADLVASKRAEKLAEKRAEEIVAARMKDELAKVYREYPRQPALTGGGPVGDDLPFDATDGEDDLRAWYRSQGR